MFLPGRDIALALPGGKRENSDVKEGFRIPMRPLPLGGRVSPVENAVITSLLVKSIITRRQGHGVF